MRSQLLRDLDVFSMASSLEVRAPLLYPSVIAIANALPNDSRLRGKQLLKDAFHADLPAELFEHPKRGFALPWEQWLRGNLRESSLESLEDMAAAESVLDPVETRRLFTDFESGRLHWSGLWVVVTLCRWAEVQRGREGMAVDQKSNQGSTSPAAS
jgi:asparagine synthase (glutamine-hydrolysing)